MRKGLKAPLVEVTWDDACSNHGWLDDTELHEATTIRMTTVGYMVRRDRKGLALAQAHGSHGKWAEIWVIPPGWIKRVRRLK
jgi:hypothetical protein